MQFKSLNATFGKLENCTLAFSDGLNIVEAPNESGKSTLVAFLRTMLYGLKTGERGTLADKNRFMPWSGKPMCGSLDLSISDGGITLRRDTVRANSPMGHFSAVYTGTGTEVSSLTGSDCGEALLGIPREVYERSAFIRQNGLAIDSDAELERRIAALITTGEEGASYSETADKLKKQLNARKHNKTGKIPALEGEIAELESEVSELHRLSSERTDAESNLSALQAEKERIKSVLTAHDLFDKQAAASARQAAEREASEADAKCEVLYRMMRDANVPERETLEQGRAKLHALDGLTAQREAADKKRQEAWDACEAFSSTMSAKRRSCLSEIISWTAPMLFLTLSIPFARRDMWTPAVVCSFLFLFCVALCIFLNCRRERKYGTQLRHYDELLNVAKTAEEAYDTINTTCEAQLEWLLADIPVSDVAQARAYIDENLSRYETLAKFQQDTERAQMRLEMLPPVNDVLPSINAVERPTESRETLQGALSDVTARCSELQRTIDFTDGRIRAIGEREVLESSLAEKRDYLAILYNEYDAIALAMETLECANTILQTRFSPALGQKAAELFSALTDGKYDKILLDRTFRAQAEETGSPISRDIALLSQGAADQLYFAVRLAICDLVLPEEHNIPLVLDDALTNFDDARCHKALELLLEESKKRQIILLTCQHRESTYLANREGVTVLSL